MRDCAAEALPAAETAEAEQGQRSAFCEGVATPEAKAGHRNRAAAGGGEGQAHPAEQKQKTPPSGLGTEEPFVRRKIRRECFCVPGDWTCKPVLVGTA